MDPQNGIEASSTAGSCAMRSVRMYVALMRALVAARIAAPREGLQRDQVLAALGVGAG